MRTECSSLRHLFLQRRWQLVELKVGVLQGLFGNFEIADHSATRIDGEAAGVSFGVFDFAWEKLLDLIFGCFGVEDENRRLIGVEP